MNAANVDPPPVQSRADRVLICLLALSLISNVALGVGLVSARRQIIANHSTPERNSLKTGQVLPPLDIQRLGGERETVVFSREGRPTLIYVFAPHCAWCARNLNNVKTVFSSAQRSYRIIALSLDPLVDDYAEAANLGVPVFVRPSDEVRARYALGPTPTTIIVSPVGVVLKSWVGAYAGQTQKEVEAYFGVDLPGLIRTDRPHTDSRGEAQ